MGSNDIAPPHVYQNTIPIAGLLLQSGGALWTLCYILLARESLRSKSYGMPLLALAGNLGWELVYTFYVVEMRFEQMAFLTWLIIDIAIVYGFLKHGSNEWGNYPWVKKNLSLCLVVLTAWWTLFQWAFAKWWLENGIREKSGKWYFGLEGPDTTELAFWATSFPQIMLSVDSLASLLTRQHTGGVSWPIWATRFLGTCVGFHGYYLWMWFQWREAHEYFMTPLGIVCWSTSFVADVIYAFVFVSVRKTERVLPDGRKVSVNVDGYPKPKNN